MQAQDYRVVPGLPGYGVFPDGRIVVLETGRELNQTRNKSGVTKVNVIDRDGRCVTRSVPLLVAKAFVPRSREEFNSPIHLDGDKSNCSAENLEWRPRWFAVRYHKQFSQPLAFSQWEVPITDEDSFDIYENLEEVCVSNGLWYSNVVQSCHDGTRCFPTDQKFKFLKDDELEFHR